MTHEEALTRAVNVLRTQEATCTSNLALDMAIAAYLEARGAVLCSAKPAAYAFEANPFGDRHGVMTVGSHKAGQFTTPLHTTI